ncbi:MAG: hypothetical protein N2376_04185 [Clostridia bacterium]|nr:hypothetical protein [Clostridia bacterium]
MKVKLSPGQLRWRHRRGETLDELSLVTGLSRYQIHRLIKAQKWKSGEVVITEKQLRQMVKDGLTVRQMAEKCFCSVGCIEKKSKMYGIKMRHCGNPLWAQKKCEHSQV